MTTMHSSCYADVLYISNRIRTLASYVCD